MLKLRSLGLLTPILNRILERFGDGRPSVGNVLKLNSVSNVGTEVRNCTLTISAPWWIPLWVFNHGIYTFSVYSEEPYSPYVNPAIKLKAKKKPKSAQ